MALKSHVKTDDSTWKSIENIWVKQATKWAKAQNMFVKVGPDTWKRAWPQLPENMIVMYPETLPADWLICDGDNSTPDLLSAYPAIASAVGSKTGSNTHTTASSSEVSSGKNGTGDNFISSSLDPQVTQGRYLGKHRHPLPSHSHDAADHQPLHVKIQFAVVKVDFALRADLILLYYDLNGGGAPPNWEYATDIEGRRFIRNNSSTGIDGGGSETHNHFKNMDTDISPDFEDSGPSDDDGGDYGYTDDHRHYANHYTDDVDNNPPHVNLRAIRALSDYSAIPSFTVGLFADTPPEDWTLVTDLDSNTDGALIRLDSKADFSVTGAATHDDYSSSFQSGHVRDSDRMGSHSSGTGWTNHSHTHSMNSHSHGSASSMPQHTPVIVAMKQYDSIGQMTRWTLDSNAADALGFRDAEFFGAVQFQDVNGENVCTMDQSDTQYIRVFSGWESDFILGQDMREFTILGRFESSTEAGGANATIVDRGAYWKIEIDQSESTQQTVSFYVDGSVIATVDAPYGNPYSYAMVFHSNGDVDCYFNGALQATASGQAFTATDNQPITLGRDVDEDNPAEGHFNDWMTFNMALRPIDVALIDQNYDQWVDAGMGELTDYVEPQDDSSTYIDPS